MAEGAAGGGMRLPSRSTRGNRMGALINEARDEADEEFWGQAAFAEEAADEEYVSEAEEADHFDSDFGDSEEEDDDDEGGDDEPKRRAALKPPGDRPKPKKPPGALKADAKPRALAALEGLVATANVDGGDGEAQQRAKAPKQAAELTAEQIRKSKRSTVLELSIVRERAAAEAAAKPKPKVRRVVEERPLTQEEMLAEAVHTEALNQESLARILASEEASKQRMVVAKAVYSGPIVRFRSTARDGEALIFLNGATPLDGKPRRASGVPPPRSKCAVTGRRARFRDPLTKQAYVDKAAFKALRAAAAADTVAQLPLYVRPPQPVGQRGQGSFLPSF